MVNCCVAEFKMGWTSTTGKSCVGHTIEVTMPEKIVLANYRMKVNEIAETVGVSMEHVHNILHEHICMTKL